MSEHTHHDSKLNRDSMTEDYGDIISVYTKEQGIADGVLFEAGVIDNRNIVFTTNLIAKFEKEALLVAAFKGLAACLGMSRPDLVIIYVDDDKLYADFNGQDITIMLPEDY